ncbi:RidA family protein [Desulfopila sp. IMCC35008]|uniref:RidA family protein n=1 Tax=Desulfopila sp. IMCC35008 TaxID=2653858 RepID=UPI0013CF8109|nr:RidA family protein [Desulfopila sp. IMCC35008]
MTKIIISTDKAPAAIGPYSQAVAHGDLVFISGQLPIDPTTGKLVEGDIGDRTHQIANNLKAVAQEAGLGLENIVKTTIFLTDLADFQAMNSAYNEHFSSEPPARSTVQVAALPLGSNIEIEAILCR